MSTWTLFIALFFLSCASAGFIRAQFSREHTRKTLIHSSALLACGLIAIGVTLSA
jgi:hypothetical protein